MLESLRDRGFDIRAESHADAILRVDFPQAVTEIEQTLNELEIPVEELIRGGGGETPGTQRLRRAFAAHGWSRREFTIKKVINEVQTQATSHIVDHVKRFENGGTIALEIEWNNKDPFFDRDLDNFKRLHADGGIDLGIIVTRGASLHENIRDIINEYAQRRGIENMDDLERHFDLSPTRRQRQIVERRVAAGTLFLDAWVSQFCADKYGEATTHWRKLESRIERGAGNPCPLLLIGLPSACVNRGEH